MTGIERAVAQLGGQGKLADLCGVKPPAVSKWVKRGWPSASQIERISAWTAIPAVELMSPELRQFVKGV